MSSQKEEKKEELRTLMFLVFGVAFCLVLVILFNVTFSVLYTPTMNVSAPHVQSGVSGTAISGIVLFLIALCFIICIMIVMAYKLPLVAKIIEKALILGYYLLLGGIFWGCMYALYNFCMWLAEVAKYMHISVYDVLKWIGIGVACIVTGYLLDKWIKKVLAQVGEGEKQ